MFVALSQTGLSGSQWLRSALWTLLPFAYASIADAETFRKCGMKHVATQQVSPNRPFKISKPAEFQACRSLRSFSARNQSKKASAL
jgi:hypothetical protein